MALMMLASSTLVHAGAITTGSTVASNPDHTVTFERSGNLSYGEILTNQFASQGVTFYANSGQAPVLFNNGSCNPGGLGGSSSVAFGVSTWCGVPADRSVSSFSFSSDAQELSFKYVTNNQSLFLFEALLDGMVVSSRTVSSSLNPSNTTFLFTGSVFDTVRFTESGSGSDWFWIDNLSWRSASTNNVPEPAPLTLLGLGLACLFSVRRRHERR